MKARGYAVVFTLVFLSFFVFQVQAEMIAMTVQVAASQIRETPSVVAPIVVAVTYRQKLFVFETMNGWTKVRVPGSSRYGYIFASALTVKTIPNAVSGAAVQGVSVAEISLAGKGFDQSLEEGYRTSANIDFFWVDAMEKLSYPAEACVQFLSGDDER